MAGRKRTESVWALHADLATARILIWAASVGRDADLSPDTHLYLATRYDLLSHAYRERGRQARARRYARRAAAHYREGRWSGPPHAAALALPRPKQWVIVDAVGRRVA